MGNLGLYQLMTTLSKKVGGPGKLLLLVALGGYTVVRSVEASGKKVYTLVKDKRKLKSKKNNPKIFVFIKNGMGENDLSFSEGDRFFILATHDVAVLIEIENDDNNPYFVTDEWLREVSDYDGNIWDIKNLPDDD